jgi:glutathione S-transferase
MALIFYYHPLASFCWKALIALYENDTPFQPRLVDLGNDQSRAEFKALWPIGKMPVLRDTEKNQTIPESSIVIEYLDQHYPGRTRFLPDNADLARQTRLKDRVFDLYVHEPMQKIVIDRIRPAGKSDPYGVEQARAQLQTAYDMIDSDVANKTWAIGDTFTLADCAAAPALFYANEVQPFGDSHKNVAAYFGRLMARPSFARVVKEAQPYFAMFPS